MNIEIAKLLFNIANIASIIGSTLLIKDFIKNPFTYKIFGAMLINISLISLQLGYFSLDDYISIILAFPAVIYWTIVVTYSLYKKYRGTKDV